MSGAGKKMTKAGLLDMLGLGGAPAGPAKGQASLAARDVPAGAGVGKAAAVAGPQALVLDRWSVRRGQDFLKEHGGRMKALDVADGPEATAACAADLLSAAYDRRPKLAEACADGQRHKFLEGLLQAEEYKGLHRLTALDEFNSELAALKFAEQLAALRARQKAEPPKSEAEADIQVGEAVGAAVRAAAQGVEEAQEAAAACGHGHGQGGKMGTEKMAALYRRVQGDPHLKRIMALAGRYRRLAQARQRNKPVHGYDDMVGPEQGSDVGRLLPSELASLAVPGLDDDVLVRLVQGQARVRDLRTLEAEGKGPIVVAVDESSSMEDADRIHQAKALALAMAWVARHQRRWCCLLAWSSRGQRRHVVLPPGGWDEARLLEWLVGFFKGGTDLPLDHLPGLWQEAGAPAGRTDVLLLTDGICTVSDQERDAFLAWKAQAKAKMNTLVIGCGHAAYHGSGGLGGLESVSDALQVVDDLAVGSEAVGEAVSI